jgi:chromosome segregation ATPase
MQLTMEARRPGDWIEHDRTQYWPRQVQRASDAVTEARLILQRCELTIDGSERFCYDERTILEKAQRRLHEAEAKVAAVKRWRVEIRKEIEAFEVQAAKLQQYLESDFTRGTAALDRMTAALDQYVQQSGSAVTRGPSAGELR